MLDIEDLEVALDADAGVVKAIDHLTLAIERGGSTQVGRFAHFRNAVFATGHGLRDRHRRGARSRERG